jgi:hypothetical protein
LLRVRRERRLRGTETEETERKETDETEGKETEETEGTETEETEEREGKGVDAEERRHGEQRRSNYCGSVRFFVCRAC